MLHQRPFSLALHQAHLERARPPQLLANERDGLASQQVFDVLVLIDLINLVEKMGKSKSNAFKVKVAKMGAVVQISALGHQLLEYVPWLGMALRAVSEVRFDPRIDVAAVAARDRGLSVYDVNTLRSMLYRDPWPAVNVLNGFVDQVRHAVNTRAFIHHMQRHKDKQATSLRELTAYFKRVADQHPAATVLRLELRGHPQAGGQHRFLQSSAVSLVQALNDWLRQAESAYGKTIVAHAWRIDFDSSEGFFAHIALVVDGPQPTELQAMERSLDASWRSMAGGASYCLTCKGAAVELEYRGGRPDAWNYSLNEELRDAAIFLVGTDSLFAWDFDGKPPTQGRGRMPDAGQRSGRSPVVREARPAAPLALGYEGKRHER